MMCEKCIYRKNCQFLFKHRKAKVASCTAFKSEAELKDEAIREFAERLKEAFPQTDRNNICPALYYDDYCYIIDELAEEMTEKEGGEG